MRFLMSDNQKIHHISYSAYNMTSEIYPIKSS